MTEAVKPNPHQAEIDKAEALAKENESEARANQALAMNAEKSAYQTTIQELMQTILNMRSNVNFLQLKLNEATAKIDVLKKQLANANSAAPKANEEKPNGVAS